LYIYVDGAEVTDVDASGSDFAFNDSHDNYKFFVGHNFDLTPANVKSFIGHIYEIRLYGTQLDSLGVWKDYNPCIIDTQFWSYMECIDICAGS